MEELEAVEAVRSLLLVGVRRGVSEMPRQIQASRGDDGFNHMSPIHSSISVLPVRQSRSRTSLAHTCVSTLLIPRSA